MNFRQLNIDTLHNYVTHYNLETPPGMSQEDLAVIIARHFELETKRLDEEEIIGTFLGSYERAIGKALGYEPASKRAKNGGNHSTNASRGQSNALGSSNISSRDSRLSFRNGSGSADSLGPAKENELVAAKTLEEDGKNEDGQIDWILATVKKYSPEEDEYDVVDEDDPLKLIRLKRNRVRRLEDGIGMLQKGDPVLAVFPDTTSFYRGRISKPVKNRGIGMAEIFVQFFEDADVSGRTPHRRVPPKHIMPCPDM